MRKVMVTLVSMVLGFSCGGGPEEDGWELGDELIVIWTIPRPGEEPEQPTNIDDPDPDRPDRPDEPDEPDRPVIPTPAEPTVSPTACDADLWTITAPGQITGTLQRGRGEVGEMPCASSEGKEQRYRIEVPHRMGVEIWTTWTETDFSPVLLLQQGCGEETVDIQCSSPLHSHPDPYSAHIRTELDAGAYTLIVDERSLLDYGEGGRFTVHVDEIELDRNALCENAEALYPDNIPTVALPAVGSTGDLRGCFGTSERHYFEMQIPPRTGAVVRAAYDTDDPNVSQGPHIVIRDSCYGDCASWPSHTYGLASVANESDEYVTYWVGVSGRYDLGYRVWLENMQPLAPNRDCAQAAPLPANVPISGDLVAGSDFAPFCASDEARQLFYSVTVPAMHRLVPEATVMVGVQNACNVEMCEVEPVINDTNTAQTRILAVGNWWAESTTSFDLTAHVVPLAPNHSCEAPTPLTAFEPRSGHLQNGGLYTSTCAPVHPGQHSLWYAVTIPANGAVQIEATPEDEFGALAVEVMDGGCGGACLVAHDPYLQGPGPVALQVANDQPAAKTVHVSVTTNAIADEPRGFTIVALPR